ncbi:hypothetical protein Nepgr_002244 [Nepenthes gracilis]|uniref:DEK-C domain-containing protein n=1 Tax=Nepenthes gracilis TaxID=150966 RepID=A0AAD3P3K4_NEPGR|nr:hypothetical protein Nepgr_002244 [Nepenthes gracilis]
MDIETRRRIEETVAEILRKADMDTMTELNVRAIAAEKLGVDLSGVIYKKLIRQLIEAFLLSIDDQIASQNQADGAIECVPIPPRDNKAVLEEPDDTEPNATAIAEGCGGDWSRFICKLSNMRNVIVASSKGKSVVSIGEFYGKDGKYISSRDGIILTSEQWSTFKNSIPAIEEAIQKAESMIRSELAQKHNEYTHKIPAFGGDIPKQQADTRNRPKFAGKQVEGKSNAAYSTACGLSPIEVIRFDGTNYHQWAQRMELLLNQFNVAHVLVDPCPRSTGERAEEIAQTMAAAQKWMDGDYICRLNILSSLSDHLFDKYSKMRGSAKDLWEELKLLYDFEEHRSWVSLVKKYVEFEMVEGKSVLDQVEEFHQIADSIVSAGMLIEEKFHVSVIISKLPLSWKNFAIRMEREEHLPLWLLMNHLKLEEESCGKGTSSGALPVRAAMELQLARKLRPYRTIMKKQPGILPAYHEWERDRKVVVKFCNVCRKKGHLTEQCWFKESQVQ